MSSKIEILVVVLAVDLQFDFHQVAAFDHRKIRQFLPLVFFDLLIDRLPARAGRVDRLVGLDQLVILPVDLDFQPGPLG